MTGTGTAIDEDPTWVPVRFAAGAIDLRDHARRLPARLPARVWGATDPVSGYRLSLHLIPQPAPPKKKYTLTDTVLLIRPPSPTPDPAAAVIATTAGDRPAMHPLMMALYGLRTLLDKREALRNREGRATLTPVLTETIAQEWARIPALHAAIAHRTLDGPAARIGLGAALEFTSQGIADPDTMAALWEAGLLGSDLKRWLRGGWTPAEILAWSTVLPYPPSRDWVEHGYTPRAVHAWIEAGLHRFADLTWWRGQTGWDDQTIADWAFTGDPAQVPAWQATKMTPATARQWFRWGNFTAEQARTARACAITVADAQALLDPIQGPPEAAAATLHAYLDLLVRARGVPLPTVHACIRAGLDPMEAAARADQDLLDWDDLALLAALRGNDQTWAAALAAAEQALT